MSVMLSYPRRLRATAIYAVLVALTGALALPASAQSPAPQGQAAANQADQNQAPLNDAQLQQLVAPIALYPDDLLAQVLTASTYPLELVMAARWARENPNVKGNELEAAMQKESWDPSVKGLTSVPQVLQMMSEHLDWTEQLGDAFLAQPDDITKAVQGLRAKADAAGNLKSSKELKVTKKTTARAPTDTSAVAEQYIEIEPAEPDVVYVPVYDPMVVYGAWPYPIYRPFYWYPPGYAYAGVFGFGAAFVVGPALWYHYDWRYHHVLINVRRYNAFNHTRLKANAALRWQHNPVHRGNVPYRNVKLQQQFGKGKIGGANVKGTGNLKTIGTVKGTNIKGTANVKGTGNVKGTNLKGTGNVNGTNKSKGTGNIKSNTAVRGAGPKAFQGGNVGGPKGANRVGGPKNAGGGGPKKKKN